MATGRTFDIKVELGTDAWLIDFTDASAGANVQPSVANTQNPILGRRDENAVNHSATHVINLPTVYVGDETDALRLRQGSRDTPWLVIYDPLADTEMAIVMSTILTGVGENAPTTDVIVTPLTFPQHDRMFVGRDVIPFNFNSAGKSKTLRDIAADEVVFVIFQNIDVAGAYSLAGANIPSRAADAKGVLLARDKGTAASSPTFSQTVNFTGNNENSGIILICKEVGA